MRPGESRSRSQEPALSSSPLPVDDVAIGAEPGKATGVAGQDETTACPSADSASMQNALRQGAHAAGQALSFFPQIVHILADPQVHLGVELSKATGLPVITLSKSSVDSLSNLIKDERYLNGFILEGFPVSESQARALDGILESSSKLEHRVLGWQAASEEQQEVVDHYINQGMLWSLDSVISPNEGQKAVEVLVECIDTL